MALEVSIELPEWAEKFMVPAQYKCIYGGRSSGKALADDTPIATSLGWTNIGDLKPGDKVFDENGKICNVTGVYPQGLRSDAKCVVFRGGESIIASSDHLWITHSKLERRKLYKKKIISHFDWHKKSPITTKLIEKTIKHQSDKQNEFNHSIPIAHPLVLPPTKLLIDPYVLGLWLGDGTAVAPHITCHIDDEPYYRESVLKAGENWSIHADKRNPNTLTCSLAKESSHQILFRHRLKKLNIFNYKHIPQEYMRASINQRMSLVQGLVDSDGYVKNGTIEFSNTNYLLVLDLMELVNSLGHKASMRYKGCKL